MPRPRSRLYFEATWPCVRSASAADRLREVEVVVRVHLRAGGLEARAVLGVVGVLPVGQGGIDVVLVGAARDVRPQLASTPDGSRTRRRPRRSTGCRTAGGDARRRSRWGRRDRRRRRRRRRAASPRPAPRRRRSSLLVPAPVERPGHVVGLRVEGLRSRVPPGAALTVWHADDALPVAIGEEQLDREIRRLVVGAQGGAGDARAAVRAAWGCRPRAPGTGRWR